MVNQNYAGDGAEENCCVCGKNTGAAPVAPAPVAAVVPRSDFCSTVDSDSCLQAAPGWDSLVTTYTCAGSTSWCTSWSKDMQRCCPFSCGSGELLEPECNLLPDQGTCIYPNAAQCPPTSAVVAPVAASAGCILALRAAARSARRPVRARRRRRFTAHLTLTAPARTATATRRRERAFATRGGRARRAAK
jgi:hypothetical protein